MKKVLFFLDAPANALFAWASLIITYSVIVQFNIQNDLVLKIVIQLAAFDCFEIHMMRRIREKVAATYSKEHGEELDDYTLNEAIERHRKSWSYLLIVGSAMVATFLAEILISLAIEAFKFLISF